MLRSVVRVCTVAVILTAWPQAATAQWYVNPYIGQVFNVAQPFSDPATVPSIPDKTTVFGIAAGTSPLGRVGLEIDFQRVNNMFRKGDTPFSEDELEALTGSNNLQSLTAAVHAGHSIGASGRFRPYGVAGGGLNIVHLGTEVQPDFETLFNLPPAQQDAIDNCVNALGPTPTVAQAQNCGVPLTEQELSGYRAMLTFGGGLTVKLAKNLAAKGDVRYAREIPTDPDGPFTFWRITFGVVIHP